MLGRLIFVAMVGFQEANVFECPCCHGRSLQNGAILLSHCYHDVFLHLYNQYNNGLGCFACSVQMPDAQGFFSCLWSEMSDKVLCLCLSKERYCMWSCNVCLGVLHGAGLVSVIKQWMMISVKYSSCDSWDVAKSWQTKSC
jgi:hypothetical protein